MYRFVPFSPNAHMGNRWSIDQQLESLIGSKQDWLVRNGAKSGALGGMRTPDTWFRRPIRIVLNVPIPCALARFRIYRLSWNPEPSQVLRPYTIGSGSKVVAN